MWRALAHAKTLTGRFVRAKIAHTSIRNFTAQIYTLRIGIITYSRIYRTYECRYLYACLCRCQCMGFCLLLALVIIASWFLLCRLFIHSISFFFVALLLSLLVRSLLHSFLLPRYTLALKDLIVTYHLSDIFPFIVERNQINAYNKKFVREINV